MSITRADRRIVTFYAYKGGVGRTMALANVAYRLADTHALDVIAVDWDLEAPGLHTFFGISERELAEARGVLDYLEAWQEAVLHKDPEPPDATDWLMRIQEGRHGPRHGSLRLLIAGRQDAAYDSRLARFDWKAFYETSAGARAVETLRAQLVDRADVVLVDSRTGLTDPGGICTVQLPDSVMLMTAPNRQSLDGIERVARSIAEAGPEQRAGRKKPRVWLSVCRVPIVEETTLAESWLARQKPWFDAGIEQDLWKKEEHPYGLRTYLVPQRARYGFGEELIGRATETLAHEPLAEAYDELAATLLQWSVDPFGKAELVEPTAVPREEEQIPLLLKRVQEAEARDDVRGLMLVVAELGVAQLKAGQSDEALRVLERAAALAQGQGDREVHAAVNFLMGSALAQQGEHDAALRRYEQAIREAEALENRQLTSIARMYASTSALEIQRLDDALQLVSLAFEEFRALGDEKRADQALRTMLTLQILDVKARPVTRMREELERQARERASRARSANRPDLEAVLIRQLLTLSEIGPTLGDHDGLQRRLAELEGQTAPPQPSPAPAPRPKRRRPAR
ncbi:KGGVGR-motif variant AAA ATPase [Sorangium sp. So ce861]|uniref:KGGVGR-motif variant AAA ATPase n=1 Tax=Sorangium sp. So ce861 TaxID=3133323 RepID=UPI003F6056AB